MIEKDEEYLDKKFPKGDKRRGEAMVLMALGRFVGREEKTYKLGEKEMIINFWEDYVIVF